MPFLLEQAFHWSLCRPPHNPGDQGKGYGPEVPELRLNSLGHHGPGARRSPRGPKPTQWRPEAKCPKGLYGTGFFEVPLHLKFSTHLLCASPGP